MIAIPQLVASPADGWERNAIVIPVSEEMLIDAGHFGPRHRLIPDAELWRERWRAKERENESGTWPFGLMFRTAPPYEHQDRGVQLEVHPFPRWDAVEAWTTPKLIEARRRLANAVDMLKGADPECTADHW